MQLSSKAARFTESVIREMSRICAREQGVNLAQGFPDFAAPHEMKEAAKRAIDADINQYAVTWGAPRLRAAIAQRAQAYNRIPTDADANVTVCCGATECMIAAILAILDPGDEVLVFEPYYENYGPDCILSGAVPRFVRLQPPGFSLDPVALRAGLGPRTRAIVLNTPHNPTGKVFTREELEQLASFAIEHDLLVITDEIYEYILFGGREHLSIATLPGMLDRTVTISGLSKTWSATGWRIGWCIAPQPITAAIRKVHDFLTVGAPAPLQEAAAAALQFPPIYFDQLRRDYEQRRDLLNGVLRRVGFEVFEPAGAYYTMVDFTRHARSSETDVDFAMRLLSDGGVACVPGSSFFRDPAAGRRMVRFCFAKRLETLQRAERILLDRLA